MPPSIPEKPGSSPKSSIILCDVAFGAAGGLPPPVFRKELFSFVISFLASFFIARHFSRISIGDLFATPRAFTFSHMSCQTAFFRLFVIVEENFSRITSIFSSDNCRIKAHSAAEKFGFLARLLSIFIFLKISMQRVEKPVYPSYN